MRFNKEGNLLAVTTADNGFKILANTVGHRYLKVNENPNFEAVLRNPIVPLSVKASSFFFFFLKYGFPHLTKSSIYPSLVFLLCRLPALLRLQMPAQ